VQFTRASVADW